MTEAYREQHPLLNDDLSEEEHFSPHRRFRPMAFRSRVRNKVKGAASIIRRWPGFWSSALIYWWIGLGMILITTLLIYNGITISALMSMESNTTPMIRINDMRHPLEQKSYLPEVFVHVFLNKGEEIDLENYLPYIEKLSRQYKEYTYHLTIVVNDTTVDHAVSAEENNEIALNSILYDSDVDKKKNIKNINGILFEQISLQKYLDSSPLRKNWRNIPPQFIEFLVRAISIWDKGGIAFNPIILTPQSPNFIHNKMQQILEKYSSKSNNQDKEYYVEKPSTNNQKPRLNNIRDIIDAMEQIDEIKQDSKDKEGKDLLEPAESRFLGPIILNILNDTKMVIDKLSGSLQLNRAENLKTNEKEGGKYSEHNVTNIEKNNNEKSQKYLDDDNLHPSFLPNVLKYLLNKNINEKSKPEYTKNMSTSFNSSRQRKSVINHKSLDRVNNKEKLNNNDEVLKNDVLNYKPMIVPANKSLGEKVIHRQYGDNNVFYDNNRASDSLTIGLNGNILATNTSCHAFIGTLFNNVYHHGSEETITNLIIDELSVFCKGLLASCPGIDVILL